MPISLEQVKNQKFAFLSILVSLINLVILTAVASIAHAYQDRNLNFESAILFAGRFGFASLSFAVIGLFRSRERGLAAIAILLWLATGVIVSLYLAV